MGNFIRGLLSENSGRKIGTLIGVLIGLCVVLFGFLSTLFIIVCTVIGYFIGRIKDYYDSDSDEFKHMF